MKHLIPITFILCTSIAMQSCQQPQSQNSNKTDSTSTNTTKDNNALVSDDYRPISELTFLNKAKAQYDNYSETAAQKDMAVTAFNKYALDSLKKIANWEFIVTGVDDSKANASSFAQAFLDIDNNDVYNVELVAPIHFDKSVDTIAINNKVNFVYTIPKIPKGDTLKNQLKVIQNLKAGDTVIISGAITLIDNNLKVNFSDVFDKGIPWNVDILATGIKKK